VPKPLYLFVDSVTVCLVGGGAEESFATEACAKRTKSVGSTSIVNFCCLRSCIPKHMSVLVQGDVAAGIRALGELPYLESDLHIGQ
jgi:hypothetical protein